MNSSAMRIHDRIRAARRKALVRTFSRAMPFYLVNEFPKSGGTWLATMLADALGVPFRRNAGVRLEESVTHGHYLNPVGLFRPIVLWRDPRDLLVSLYYHCYFLNEHGNAGLVQLMKARRPFDDYADIRANLPQFIQFISRRPVSPSFSWPSFAAVWIDRPDTCQTSYEALRADTVGELSRVLRDTTGQTLDREVAEAVVARHSFEMHKRRAEALPGNAEMSFVREGSVGGWKRHFSKEALQELEAHGYVEWMDALGYQS